MREGTTVKLTRCINLDWLEVYALEDFEHFPCDAEFFRNNGYQVLERDYGTRVYKEMFTLLDWHDEPLLEIRRAPASSVARDGGIFPENACHIRLSNRTCYAADPIGILREFMVKFNYELVKIFRIDICLDFDRFDRGDDPAKFIDRYIRRKYSKINQCEIASHGVDRWDGRIWNSLSWGQPKSMVSTKIYCKSLELQQKKDKPYIKMAWFYSGLIDDPINLTRREPNGSVVKPNIYRVEFSIKSSAKKWFVIDRATGKKGKIVFPNTLDMYDTRQKLLTVFASLANHYFHFKVYQDGVRKDRCPDKILFTFSPLDTLYKVDRLASHTAKTKPTERLIHLLENYSTTHPNDELRRAIKIIVNYIKNDILREMSERGTYQDELTAFRQLIAERINGKKDTDIIKRYQEILNLIQNSDDIF